ncbi:MAG: hypothetical protein RMK29_03925 [Myxococcales bacterium]|nr:hypothetical protein [Myxococcota bacterium]MDW8280835.1 hypothetical protein [Myxococcales bacterium]
MDPACIPPGPQVPARSQSIATLDRPLAAVLDPTGKTVYATTIDINGNAQLVSISASGGEPARIATAEVLSYPVGLAIKPDGSALFVADIGDPGGSSDEAGGVIQVSIRGGSTRFALGELRHPAGIAVSHDGRELFVTGVSAEDGRPGVWRFAESGGPPTAIYKGDPLRGPSGIVMAEDGTLYVADPTALGPRDGAVIRIGSGGAAVLNRAPIQMSFPAGIAAAGPGHPDVLVTGTMPRTGLGALLRISPSGEIFPVDIGQRLLDPAALHRAARSAVWVLVEATHVPMQLDPLQATGLLFQLVP